MIDIRVVKQALDCKQNQARRDGRVVEGAALEMLFRGNFNEGSNPSLSVKKS